MITEGYRLMGISVRTPSSFALMDYPQGPLMPADFLEQLVSLCRVAKQDTSHMLVEYSDVSIQKMRHMSNMALAPDGTVLPCQSWLEGPGLGNLLTDDWSGIWDGEPCRRIRAESAKMEHICQLRQEGGC